MLGEDRLLLIKMSCVIGHACSAQFLLHKYVLCAKASKVTYFSSGLVNN